MKLDWAERVGAGYGAMLGLLLLWTVMSLVTDRSWCGSLWCRSGGLFSYAARPITLDWRPFVDNPSRRPRVAAEDEGPRCPGAERDQPDAILDLSPMPRGFNPRSPFVQGLYACVKVGPGGRVLAAYLPDRKGLFAYEARAVTDMILDFWRFVPSPDRTASWQRVRLFERSAPLGARSRLDPYPPLS